MKSTKAIERAKATRSKELKSEKYTRNKVENVHRFAPRGELFWGKREREGERGG